MKKLVAVAVLAGMSFSAQSAENKMYGVVGIGSASNFGTAFSIAGGMELTKIKTANKPVVVSGEVGYQSFGSVDIFPGVSVSASAFYGAAVGRYEINNDLSATGKLGLASVSAESALPCVPVFGGGCFPGTGVTVSSSSMELLYGIGLDYSLEKSMNAPVSVGVEYNDYGGESVFGGRVSMKF